MAIDTIERVRLTITEARALSERACYGMLAFNMNTYELETPAPPTEKALTT